MDDESNGFCEAYRGTVCSQYIGNQSIYVESLDSQDLMEQKIGDVFIVIKTSQDISPQCHRFAIPSLCYSSFPPCDHTSRPVRPRKVFT